MAMEPGTTLGPYRIVRKIGAGGMGEVYAATDTRLGREVAIKVLPRDMVQDAEALRRFQQEAMTVAALNHPNLVHIFDVGQAEDGSPFLVMELMEGETLRARMGAKPMPVRKVAEICAQVARGLGAAHTKGVVHRDIKPENVFVTKQGLAKVLDFGLAKLGQREGESLLADGGDDHTRALFTKPGMVLGTVGYMSPEQVEGRNADARSDIFSLGVMMWEMVAGLRPFHRDSHIDTLHAVLREDPPEVDEALGLPTAMERILRRCLEKDPDDRFQSAQDLAFQLENLTSGSGSAKTMTLTALTGEVSAEPGRPWYRTPHKVLYPLPVKLPPRLRVCFWDRVQLSAVYLLAGAFFIAVILSSLGLVDLGGPGRRELAKTFEPAMAVNGNIQTAAVSRNGNHTLMAIADDGGETRVFYRRRGESAQTVPMPPDTEIQAVANDGTALLLNLKGDLHLQKLGQDANAMKVATHITEADCTPDGAKIAVLRRAGGKYQVEFPLGTVCYAVANRLRDLAVSPRGDALAFMERDPKGVGFHLRILRPGGTPETWKGGPQLAPNGTFPFLALRGLAWNNEGDGLFVALQGNLLALVRRHGAQVLHRDAGSVTLHGASVDGPLLEVGAELDVDRGRCAQGDKEADLTWTGGATVALSDDGSRLLVNREQEAWLLPANRSKGSRLASGTGEALSGDGRIVLVTSNERIMAIPTAGGDTCLVTTRDELRKLGYVFTGDTTDPKLVLSRDGKWAMFSAGQLLYRRRTDASEALEQVDVPAQDLGTGWRIDSASSPDGGSFALQVRDGEEKRWCLIFDAKGKKVLHAVKLEDTERFMAWKEGDSCLIFSSAKGAAEFRSLDLPSGKRTSLRAVAPPIPDVSARFRNVKSSLDGSFYIYRYNAMGASQLLVAKGLTN